MAADGAGGASGRRRHDLIESLVVAHHAELAAGALLERSESDLQISHLGEQLPIALALLPIGRFLRLERLIEPPDLPHALIGHPQAVLQQDQADAKMIAKILMGSVA